MKNNLKNISLLILLFTALGYSQSDKEKINLSSNSYFPVNDEITLVYESSFGESLT
jgi:hypothetical protein